MAKKTGADATDTTEARAPGGSVAPHSYRVLARKYRPATFDDLIGQSAMVRTVSNAFETGRIPQAWILTGVRGVGKTTTARILARALNYELADGSVTKPTVTMPELGMHCQAIMESRHIDVLEMDAASHRGIDDIRQINEAARYAPVSARYKVYILDEVHMLTEPAFNALLKTLEEPPPHAKFIFATTEIRKVPITILSRCQRFDLRRIEPSMLVAHLEGICAKEGVTIEPEALALIARAAEGSVRDSLSLLDQAISHAAGEVRAEDVRQMLGLADRTRVIDLFDALMRGDAQAALTELREQYESGADPAVVIADLAEFTHFVTRIKIVPSSAEDRSLAETERTRGRAFATSLSMRVLSRTWQMLFKGLPEVQGADKPITAAEMVLVRIAYAADLPSPDEVIRSLASDNGDAPAPSGGGRAIQSPATNGGNGAPQTRIDAPRGGGGPRTGACPEYRSPRSARTIGCRSRERAPHQHLWRTDRACRRSARPAVQDRARTRRAAGTLRGWPAGNCAGAFRVESADRRSRQQDFAMDRPPLDGRSFPPNRARRPCVRRSMRGARKTNAACAPTRWCRPCCKNFPARRSWPCARATAIRNRHPQIIPTTSRRPMMSRRLMTMNRRSRIADG